MKSFIKNKIEYMKHFISNNVSKKNYVIDMELNIIST